MPIFFSLFCLVLLINNWFNIILLVCWEWFVDNISSDPKWYYFTGVGVTPYLPAGDEGCSKAATGPYMFRSGYPYSAQGTDNVLQKIKGKRIARVLHLFFLFLSVLLFHRRDLFFFLFCCPELYLCKSFSAVFVLREVTCLCLEGSYWVDAIASLVDFSQ